MADEVIENTSCVPSCVDLCAAAVAASVVSLGTQQCRCLLDALKEIPSPLLTKITMCSSPFVLDKFQHAGVLTGLVLKKRWQEFVWKLDSVFGAAHVVMKHRYLGDPHEEYFQKLWHHFISLYMIDKQLTTSIDLFAKELSLPLRHTPSHDPTSSSERNTLSSQYVISTAQFVTTVSHHVTKLKLNNLLVDVLLSESRLDLLRGLTSNVEMLFLTNLTFPVTVMQLLSVVGFYTAKHVHLKYQGGVASSMPLALDRNRITQLELTGCGFSTELLAEMSAWLANCNTLESLEVCDAILPEDCSGKLFCEIFMRKRDFHSLKWESTKQFGLLLYVLLYRKCLGGCPSCSTVDGAASGLLHTSLRRLSIRECELARNDVTALARYIGCGTTANSLPNADFLNELDLCRCVLDAGQVEAILLQLKGSKTLSTLKLAYNDVDCDIGDLPSLVQLIGNDTLCYLDISGTGIRNLLNEEITSMLKCNRNLSSLLIASLDVSWHDLSVLLMDARALVGLKYLDAGSIPMTEVDTVMLARSLRLSGRHLDYLTITFAVRLPRRRPAADGVAVLRHSVHKLRFVLAGDMRKEHVSVM